MDDEGRRVTHIWLGLFSQEKRRLRGILSMLIDT